MQYQSCSSTCSEQPIFRLLLRFQIVAVPSVAATCSFVLILRLLHAAELSEFNVLKAFWFLHLNNSYQSVYYSGGTALQSLLSNSWCPPPPQVQNSCFQRILSKLLQVYI